MSDVLALFLADLNRAADGLRQSLALGSTGAFHASLHARDLGDALYGVDLRPHADLAIDISRHLAKGLPGLEMPAKELLGAVADAVEKIASGVALRDLPEDPRLTGITQALSAFEDVSIDSEIPPLDEPLILAQSEREEDQVFVWQGAPAPAIKRVAADHGHTEPAMAALNQHVFGGISEQNIFIGLATVKAIERELDSFLPADAARRACYALSDHANWLATLRQLPLEHVLKEHCQQIAVPHAGVDSDIAELLRQAFGEIGPVQEVSGSVQQMTVFLRLRGLANVQQALPRLGQLMQAVQGRVDSMGFGLELVFPSSLQRFRVVPFRRGSQLLAVSWAQFLGAQTLQPGQAAENPDHRPSDALGLAEDVRLSVQIKSGAKVHRFFASEVRHFEVANAYRISNSVRTEPWVRGLLIGQDSEPALWVDPEGF